jgi:hypothetical protein
MSWHFSPAQVVAYLEANSLDGEQFAPLNGNPIPQAYLSKDRMTAFSRLSRFGMTFAPFEENHGEELLMWYLEAFHARTSQQPGGAMDSTANGRDSGVKWPASSAKYDRNSHLWKTRQCSLLGDLEPFLETWPRWGTMRNGEFWERLTPDLPIEDKGFGYWPTPLKTDFKATGQIEKMKKHGFEGNHQNRPQYEYARRFNMKMSSAQSESMMLWPIGWTDLAPLETDKFRLWSDSHGLYSEVKNEPLGTTGAQPSPRRQAESAQARRSDSGLHEEGSR